MPRMTKLALAYARSLYGVKLLHPRPRFESGEPCWLCIVTEDVGGNRLAWRINEDGAIVGATDRGTLPVDAALESFGCDRS